MPDLARTSEFYVGQPYRPQQVALGLGLREAMPFEHVLTSPPHVLCDSRAGNLESLLINVTLPNKERTSFKEGSTVSCRSRVTPCQNIGVLTKRSRKLP